MAHEDRIKARAKELGNVPSSSEVKFTSEILTQALSLMEDKLGSAGFGNYVRMFTENDYLSTTPYQELEDGQRKLRKLESAESYFALYFLALALKRLSKDGVITNRATMGEGSLTVAPVQQIVDMRSQYLRQGEAILRGLNVESNLGMVVV